MPQEDDDLLRLVVRGRYRKDMELWEEESPTGTRVLKKIARNSRRKRMQDEY